MISLALLVVLHAAPDLAKTEEPSVVQAREAFVAGEKLYRQAKYAEALIKFEEARTLRPHPTIFFNIARCEEQLGATGKALRFYRVYLRLSPEASDRDQVLGAIAKLEGKLQAAGVQQLLVFAEPLAAVIELDGKALGSSPASVELTAGKHTLVVSAPGYERVERAFVMALARSEEMRVRLRPLELPVPPPPPLVDVPKKDEPTPVLTPKPAAPPPAVIAAPSPPQKGRVFTWVAGGVAVAGAATAVGLGVAGLGAADEYRAQERPGAEQQVILARARGLETGTNVAWGVAGAAAITAVVLFFLEGK